jgi:hypothetical protein
MRNQLAAVPMFVAALWLATMPMAAQGRGQGGPPAGLGGGAGAHGSLGAPTGHGTTHPAAAKPLGPMSPTSLLQQNTKLAAKLATFFPQGTDLSAEAAGFKNLGQFVSAVHVSHNLGIPFADLKCSELGTVKATASGTTCSSSVTNQNAESLGKAIQTLKPEANSPKAIQEADRQGEQDLKDVKPDGKS